MGDMHEPYGEIKPKLIGILMVIEFLKSDLNHRTDFMFIAKREIKVEQKILPFFIVELNGDES